jgi:hypothetical protein
VFGPDAGDIGVQAGDKVDAELINGWIEEIA